MFHLAVVTCVVLGTTLAKPPPPAKRAEGADELGSYSDPEPILFLKDEERNTYTLSTGLYYFVSPNYPTNYPNDLDGSITLIGDNNQDITITCNPFAMEYHPSCGWDFLSINEVKYCGTSAPPTTTVKELRVRVYTDHSVTAGGFYCLLTVTDCSCGQRQTRVVGGADAALGQFPWQAGLVRTADTRTFCGGSVISNRYVLTSAHCITGVTASQIQVMLGDLNIGTADAGEQRFSVQQIINHPSYAGHTLNGWDFSLLRLDRDIVYSSTIQPVCLPTAGETYADVTAIASGFGEMVVSGPQATTLQHVQLPVWSQSSCTSVWGSKIQSSMICAGGQQEGIPQVCESDSGGPLVTEVSGRFRLIGVASWGFPCDLENTPDVYARVTEALSWITANAANTCSPP